MKRVNCSKYFIISIIDTQMYSFPITWLKQFISQQFLCAQLANDAVVHCVQLGNDASSTLCTTGK